MPSTTKRLSIRAYARYRGVSHSAVRKAIAKGRITAVDDGIDPVQADREWEANTDVAKRTVVGSRSAVQQTKTTSASRPRPASPQSARAPSDTSSPSATYSQSRGVRETYLARLAKVDYEERIRKLVDADQMRVAQFNAARKARDILISVPSRIAPLVVGMTEAAEVERILDVEIRRVCAEIAEATKL